MNSPKQTTRLYKTHGLQQRLESGPRKKRTTRKTKLRNNKLSFCQVRDIAPLRNRKPKVGIFCLELRARPVRLRRRPRGLRLSSLSLYFGGFQHLKTAAPLQPLFLPHLLLVFLFYFAARRARIRCTFSLFFFVFRFVHRTWIRKNTEEG